MDELDTPSKEECTRLLASAELSEEDCEKLVSWLQKRQPSAPEEDEAVPTATASAVEEE